MFFGRVPMNNEEQEEIIKKKEQLSDEFIPKIRELKDYFAISKNIPTDEFFETIHIKNKELEEIMKKYEEIKK